MCACRPFAERVFPMAVRVAVMILFVFSLISCGLHQSRLCAEQGVKEFHALLNKEQYEVIYARSDGSLRKSWARVDFIAYLRDVHSRLGNAGKIVSRGFQIKTSIGGSTTVELAVETTFDRGAAEERFTWRIEGATAVLLAYGADIEPSAGPRSV